MKYSELITAIDSASQQLLGRVAAAVNQALVIRNWLVGAYLVEFEQEGEDRARYGEGLLETLANDLRKRGVKGLGVSMLERTRRFYLAYPQLGAGIPSPLVTELGQVLPPLAAAKSAPAVRILRRPASPDNRPPGTPTLSAPIGPQQSSNSVTTGYGISHPPVGQSAPVTPLPPEAVLRFSWTHILELIRLDDPLKRAFYENECLKGNWSKRQLQRQIGSLLYERTGLSTDKQTLLARARRQEPEQVIEDLIRDPYVLEFTGLADRAEYHESDLEKALLDDLQTFLLELGTGFCFEARQYRITTGNDHDYVDLLFYHRLLRCHVLLDLKVRAFRHADAGQMNYYVNYFKDRIMGPDDNPPVGIILCSDKDQTKVQFATAGMDNQLFVSRYLVGLPAPEQLSRFVEQDRARFETMAEAHKGLRPSGPKRPREKERPGT
jgi:predicted nuclease of restriction endonuclease-like (RecB) superfamily